MRLLSLIHLSLSLLEVTIVTCPELRKCGTCDVLTMMVRMRILSQIDHPPYKRKTVNKTTIHHLLCQMSDACLIIIIKNNQQQQQHMFFSFLINLFITHIKLQFTKGPGFFNECSRDRTVSWCRRHQILSCPIQGETLSLNSKTYRPATSLSRE